MKYFLVALFGLFFSQNIKAQPAKLNETSFHQLKTFEDTLALCGFAVINDSISENRFGACKKLIKTLVQALKAPNSFRYPFERLKSVSIQYPPDSTFRIFTWQLYVDKDDYRYYGAVQMNTPELKLYPLIDRSFEVEDVEHAVLSPEKWYGALYYNLLQFDSPEGRKYLLFGYDGYSFFNKRKLIDVLSFKADKAIFGAPVFVQTDTATGAAHVRNRLMQEYTAEASYRLNYDEAMEMITYEHLTLMAGNSGQGMTMVPDGTYEAYKLENGRWNWIQQLYGETMEEAPVPEPVLNKRNGRDLFGKEKKKKG